MVRGIINSTFGEKPHNGPVGTWILNNYKKIVDTFIL